MRILIIKFKVKQYSIWIFHLHNNNCAKQEQCNISISIPVSSSLPKA